MKVKSDFITNSSSSSFIIGLSDITAKQLKQIHNHIEEVDDIYDAWKITETDDCVECNTYMDNYDLYEYLIRIGISSKVIKSWHS